MTTQLRCPPRGTLGLKGGQTGFGCIVGLKLLPESLCSEGDNVMGGFSKGLRATMVAAVTLVGVSGAAMAQSQGPVGQVSALSGPPGSVLVIRGNVTYSLQNGDRLFAGDRVFTRTNGAVQVDYFQCAVSLTGAQSIEVQPDCAAGAVALASDATVGGVAIGTSGGGIGATPILLSTALVAVGAAAVGDGGRSSP